MGATTMGHASSSRMDGGAVVGMDGKVLLVRLPWKYSVKTMRTKIQMAC